MASLHPETALLPRPAAVLFDLDGTLVDSLPTLANVMDAVLADLGRAAIPVETLRTFVGDGVGTLVSRAMDTTGGAPAAGLDSVVADYVAHYERAPAAGTVLTAGTLSCLRALDDAGIRLAVCTNKPEAVTHLLLRDMGLAGFFGAVVGGDTCRTRKPDAEPAFEACRRLGVRPGDTCFVGDNEHDATCGRAAGCASVVILSGGYSRVPVEDLAADRIVGDLGQVPALFGL